MKNSEAKRQAFYLTADGQFLIWGTTVLLIAAFMRLIFLDEVPPGLSQDEVLNADVVNFIRNGYHAFFFREGYGHEPLYHYWSVPFQILFGDNVFSIRLPAVYLGILLVALTMRWSRREFTGIAAIVTGIGLAISWWPIIFSRIGLRPILEPFLLLCFAWFWPRRPWVAGLFLGLSVYSYTGARVVFLWPVLLFLYGLFFPGKEKAPGYALFGRSITRESLSALIVLFTALVIAIPLFLTIQGDPTLQQRVDQLSGPISALRQGDIRPILTTTLATLGVFSFRGDPRWTYGLPGEPLFAPLTSLFFYGGLLLTFIRLRISAYAFALIWLFVGLLPSAITPQAPSTVRLVGAMPVVYLMPGLFVSWLWGLIQTNTGIQAQKSHKRQTKLLKLILPLLLFVLFLLNLVRTNKNGFVEWPQALETRIKYQSVLWDIARDMEKNSDAEYVTADGFYRPITAATLIRNYGEKIESRWVQTGDEVAGALVIPTGMKREKLLYVPEYAAPHPQLLARAGVDEDPLYRSPSEPSFAVYSLEELVLNEGVEQLTFGEVLTLVGYDIFPSEDQKSLQLITIWRVDGALPDDLSTFVHWLDGEGKLISQHDGLDAAPDTLQSGDLILQRHVLNYPSQNKLDGNLAIGLYKRGDGSRLLIEEGQAINIDRLILPVSEILKNGSIEN